jgi:eukaryotic translation initiation factor 2C
MMQIPSGTLGYPILQYGKNHQEVLKNKYRWDLIEKSFFKTLRPSFSVFLLVGPGVHKSKINICMDRCREYFGSKYSVANMNFVGSNILPAVNIITLDNAMGQQTKQRKFDFAILLLGNKSVDAYAAFKNLCDRKYNAHSLCMTRNTFDGKNWQTCLSNTAMKVNLKATGSNHTIIEKNSKLREIFKNTLVLGADVTHPGPGALMACPSIAAIVGSVDDHAGRFLGSMRLQSRDNKETIDLVRPMVKERIVDWVKEQRKGIMPTNILYYRDGVSESQYTQIRDQELPEIRRAYSEAIDELSEEKIVSKESSAKVNLTAIIVAKRHHVRFFPINPNDKEAVNQNCKPGTYVEQVVTSPYFQDFYLQSHAAIKGTARPAHYFIITEEMNKSVDFYRQLV